LSNEYETLRWPTNMDRAAIVAKLAEIRDTARSEGHLELAAFFADVEAMPAPKVGASVISALTWLEGKPEYIGIGTQLSMVAMNLKNLR
jgi:hypothetical protein